MSFKITTRHDAQWRRYETRFGAIAISRTKRGIAGFIPAHTPVVSLNVTRTQAAIGLLEWRRRKNEATRQIKWN